MDTKRNRVEPERTYSFDITKADQIFDILLEDKIIKLPEGHNLPTVEEMKKKPYCKWHDMWTHQTVHCVVFRNTIQALIEKGTLKFPEKNKEKMGVDNNPFPTAGINMAKAHLSELAPPKANEEKKQELDEPKQPNEEDKPKKQPKKKSFQQILRERYEKGDPEVGLLGESSGKFDYYVLYPKKPEPDNTPIIPTGWDVDINMVAVADPKF